MQRAATPSAHSRPRLSPTLLPKLDGTFRPDTPSAAAVQAAARRVAVGSDRVTLSERMAGSRLTRHPPDAGRLQTALLVGSAKAAALDNSDHHPHHHEQQQQHLSRPPTGFARSCCTPPPDMIAARRGAALESLLTAGEYEDAFASGRARTVDEQQRQVSVRDVKQLRRFDRRLSEARALDAGDGIDRSGVPPPDIKASWKPPAGSKAAFAPPRVIQLVFRLGTVRNLPATDALKRIGYPELHEQFSVAASTSGMIYKAQYLDVLSRYLTPHEHADSLRILECFHTPGHGDVELPLFLVGLQMLLECATPGDTLRYCFQLLDAANALPRYMTRFEAQTLVTYADEAAVLETRRTAVKSGESLNGLSTEELIQRCGDRGFLSMRRSILTLIDDASRYDYCGRMPLSTFLRALEALVAESDAGGSRGGSSEGGSPGTLGGQQVRRAAATDGHNCRRGVEPHEGAHA
jgi:hypothetical protein